MKGSTFATDIQSRAKRTQARDSNSQELTSEALLAAYRMMLLSRKIDDKEIQLKNQSQIYFQLSGAGHEAILVAAASHLRPGYDWFFPYYRDRAFALALGVTPLDMFLAGVGSSEDPSSAGRQMPSHWSSRELNLPAPSSATGTQCLHGIGCAEAGLFYQKFNEALETDRFENDEITFITLGDGATSQGEFWESLNTACMKQLPVVYLVEDNGYAISVPVEAQTPGGNISRIVEHFPGMRVLRCDGTDYPESYRTMGDAIAHARDRRGPALVHATVIRPYSHSLSDDEKLYKTPAEREAEARRDPLTRMRHYLKSKGLATDEDFANILVSVEHQVREAAEQALTAPEPDPETAAHYVYSPDLDPTSDAFATEAVHGTELKTMVATINKTLHDEMAHDPHIVVFGEDVADVSREEALDQVSGKGGVFKVTLGLQRAYGSDRVFNSPLAEANIIGRALGMALRGLKPIVEIQFFDYIWPGYMQIRDELTMMRYRSANTWSCPVVIRAPIGGYLRGGSLYHSQSAVSIFAHTPGIRVVLPSNAQDAAGLLRTSIRCDDPVLFLEHKHLYRQTYNRHPYPGPNYMVPFARAAVAREGTDVVVFTWGALVQRSLMAAQQAERDGVSVAVIDLRTISPCDWETIAAYTRKTNRVIVAHEDPLTAGFGAEVAARVADDLFEYLDAPVKRVTGLDCPVAYSPVLEEAILPGPADILKAIHALIRY
jgi:2-oxoisovalerate dehydrogenase E1 component